MSMATNTTDFGSKRDAHSAHQSAYLIEALLLLTSGLHEPLRPCHAAW